jgi:hypothetical protein
MILSSPLGQDCEANLPIRWPPARLASFRDTPLEMVDGRDG